MIQPQQETEMSEQVNCHEAQYWTPTAPVVHKSDYDALHAEAEALRAENGRLRELTQKLDDQFQREVYGLNNEGDPIGGEPASGYVNDLKRMRTELEAARGLLDRAATCMHDAAFIIDSSSYRINGAAVTIYSLRRLAQELTATPAPESADHMEDVLAMVEQGARQKPVAWLRRRGDL